MYADNYPEKGRFIGIDQDAAAIAAAGERLAEFGDRVTIVRSNYCEMRRVLEELGIRKVNGIVLDLGVSSYQLDTAERGFSYREDAPLDMRMDQRQSLTARDIVNEYSEAELTRIIRDYGEDKFAGSIARHIVRARQEHPVETTLELAEIVKESIPMKARRTGGHPAKRTFQAIRIELNRELDVLRDTLDDMIDLLDEEAARKDLHHHLPFPGRPDRQDDLPQERRSVHLPEEPSGVRMRTEIQGKSDHEKTDPPVGGRAGEQFQKQECRSCVFSNAGQRSRIQQHVLWKMIEEKQRRTP